MRMHHSTIFPAVNSAVFLLIALSTPSPLAIAFALLAGIYARWAYLNAKDWRAIEEFIDRLREQG